MPNIYLPSQAICHRSDRTPFTHQIYIIKFSKIFLIFSDLQSLENMYLLRKAMSHRLEHCARSDFKSDLPTPCFKTFQCIEVEIAHKSFGNEYLTIGIISILDMFSLNHKINHDLKLFETSPVLFFPFPCIAIAKPIICFTFPKIALLIIAMHL